jgi:hypothetical protein
MRIVGFKDILAWQTENSQERCCATFKNSRRNPKTLSGFIKT